MFTACPPTHTPSHRASRPHCGGYSHPGGEDKQCGKGGEDNHHSNPLLTLHTPLTSHTLYTHSPHRLQWSQGSRTTFPVTQSQWHASPPTLLLQQVPMATFIYLFLEPLHTLSLQILSPYTLSLTLTHTGVCQIASGQSDVVIAGGVDFMSDVPIRLSRGLRKTLLSLNKVSVYHQDTISTSLSILSIWDPSFLRPKLWGLVLASFWEV